jgi:hypothetical protein
MKSAEFEDLTIRKLLFNLFDTDNIHDLLYWPPNLFAFTSIILQRTGCYRVCQIEDMDWNFVQRNSIVEDEGRVWIREVGRVLRDEKYEFDAFLEVPGKKRGIFNEAFLFIEKNLDFSLIHLRIVVSDPLTSFHEEYREVAGKAREVAKCLVDLHTVADIASTSMGMIDDNYSNDSDTNLALTSANILLTAQGTLTTLDKLHGCVLPKFRTPQQGQSLRSLSHHLTFHATETEIVWRTIPWLDTNEHSINILAVPHPFSMHTKDFKAVPYKNHPTRYFKVDIEEFNHGRTELIHSIVDKLIELRSRISRIHMILLPELSLSKKEYDYLLLLLFKYRKEINYLPIVVVGVMSDGYSNEENPHEVYNNEVKIASYFAGRWYDLNQRKHHRWRLDKNQLIQYQLATKFATHRNWFEYISTSQRKLTVLSVNSWLSMVALICEDLARLEPVSEVIRGIGPTLMLALLSDGPQLSNRWPARYATVFADDPGTSVFSLTSLGMAKRSNMKGSEPFEQEGNDKHVIGLWKDSVNANREIKVEGTLSNTSKSSIVLTLSAKFIEEFTLDGRSDEINASQLELDTYFRVSLNKKKKEEIAEEHAELLSKSDAFVGKIGTWSDIRDISLIYYCIDDVVSNKEANIKILESLLLSQTLTHSNRTFRKIFFLISKSLKDPLNIGLGVKEVEEWPSIEMKVALELIKEIITTTINQNGESESILIYYDNLFNSTEKIFQRQFRLYSDKFLQPKRSHAKRAKSNADSLDQGDIERELDKYRIQLAVCIAICVLIQSKICDRNVKGNFSKEPNYSRLSKEVAILNESINRFLNENYNEFSLYPDLIFKK